MNKIFHVRYRGTTYVISSDALNAIVTGPRTKRDRFRALRPIRFREFPTPPQVGSTASQDTNLPLQ